MSPAFIQINTVSLPTLLLNSALSIFPNDITYAMISPEVKYVSGFWAKS